MGLVGLWRSLDQLLPRARGFPKWEVSVFCHGKIDSMMQSSANKQVSLNLQGKWGKALRPAGTAGSPSPPGLR